MNSYFNLGRVGLRLFVAVGLFVGMHVHTCVREHESLHTLNVVLETAGVQEDLEALPIFCSTVEWQHLFSKDSSCVRPMIPHLGKFML